MGERLSGDGVPGRRRVHPGGAVSGHGPWEVGDVATLETVLAAVIRGGELDPEAEQRAVAAFRAAHAAGATHRARTRRRDDWRLPAERRAGRLVKMTFGVVFTSLALGGVAVAAIGSAGSSTDGAGAGRGSAHPSALAPDQPGGGASSPSFGGFGPTDRPAPAQDTEAHCRAYGQVRDRGKALDAKAWQQLVTAAGGKDKVAAYCSEQRATATPSGPAGTGKPGEGAGDTGNGTAGSTGGSHNGTSGNNSGGTDNAAGNGRASGDKGGGKHK
ncbi:hypothetical protein ACH4UM_16005 [Streptomyces sp. NPDC020801]|uniref:hypothetical protein n=1 Tax=Streptomyces sp. NPDC020801 TaxID=3365093 RepID=UPI0037A76848